MAEHKELQKAVRQMADGSKSGFHTFYLGTAQYVYSSALLLYGAHEDACRFMIDFYQYLYLHLPEYDRSQELEKWISALALERFKQLSIGKNIQPPSVQQQMASGTNKLSKNELLRVWYMLEAKMHFPAETAGRSGGRPFIVLTMLLLLLLLSYRFGPVLLEKLEAVAAASVEDVSGNEPENTGDGEENTPENANDGGTDGASDGGALTAGDTDGLAIDETLMPDGTGSASGGGALTAGDTDDASGGGALTAGGTDGLTIDETLMPDGTGSASSGDALTAGDTDDASGGNASSGKKASGDRTAKKDGAGDEDVFDAGKWDDLENLELELYYGDSVTDNGS